MAKMISELVDGDRVLIQALISNVTKGTSTNGGAYFNIELKDASGTISAKKWDIDSSDFDTLVVGKVCEVEGDVIDYKGSLQFKIKRVNELDLTLVDISRFVKTAPEEKQTLIDKFNGYIKKIQDKDCLAILNYILEKCGDKVYNIPAGVSLHHEYANGLLYHTVSMASMAEYICSYYKDINKDLLLTGILLHDLGKTEELEGTLVYSYSVKGKLLGHISIISSLIREASDALNIKGETPVLLEHMVLSHHGQLEFGSPVLPMTKEALILSLIDNMDSKIALVSRVLENTNDGEFSNKIFALDNRSIYKPKK